MIFFPIILAVVFISRFYRAFPRHSMCLIKKSHLAQIAIPDTATFCIVGYHGRGYAVDTQYVMLRNLIVLS